MKSKVLTITLIVAIGTVMVAPKLAHAGDSEWATAGKILAGLTALQVLTRSSGDDDNHHEYGRKYRHHEPRQHGRRCMPKHNNRPYRHNRHHHVRNYRQHHDEHHVHVVRVQEAYFVHESAYDRNRRQRALNSHCRSY